MKASIARLDVSRPSVASSASPSSASQADAFIAPADSGASQLAGFSIPDGFEAHQKRSRSFEEARRNHVQLNGLMAKVRKPLPLMTQRMARAGLRAGSAGANRGDYAYRDLFRPVDGKLYEMQVHPVKNLLEWNFTNLHADQAWLPCFDAPWGFAGTRQLPYGQPWQTPAMQHAADNQDSQSQFPAPYAGVSSSLQPASGFQYAALQYSPFRQGQFQYPPTDAASAAHRSLPRSATGAARRRLARPLDPADGDDTPFMQPQSMAVRRNAAQWQEAVGQLQDAGMTAADMKEWINDFHDCRRYPCAENHALFKEKYGGLFEGDIGDEKLRPAFDALRRAFGSALAPSRSATGPSPMMQAIPA